jgi:hypothetical protein
MSRRVGRRQGRRGMGLLDEGNGSEERGGEGKRGIVNKERRDMEWFGWYWGSTAFFTLKGYCMCIEEEREVIRVGRIVIKNHFNVGLFALIFVACTGICCLN